ncbi:hypothetical protein SNEBB_007081 [Seison nebaliae]|nr:hypothetical protein SNEBB_007081 [Seison nebaliae]
MSLMFEALHAYRQRRYEDCSKICDKLLERNQLDKAIWILKVRSTTRQFYIDETEIDVENIINKIDDNIIATIPRLGTSLRTANITSGAKPISAVGRPTSGMARPVSSAANQMGVNGMSTARGVTARPLSSSIGRYVRLGTASMISSPDSPFINASRLNYHKYSTDETIGKSLFLYLFHHDNDFRNALQLAALASEYKKFKDWWWKLQLGKCYFRLGMVKEAQRQFESSLKQQTMIETILLLGKLYIYIDQPLKAIEIYTDGLKNHEKQPILLTHLGRIYESLNNTSKFIETYGLVLNVDMSNIEAMTCIANHYFYNNEPEVALKFYNRLLFMGIQKSAVYNNIALCCFYSQQWDLIVSAFEKAIHLAEDDFELSDIWYNISLMCVANGDSSLAYQSLRIALAYNPESSEVYNNLGVLELRRGRLDTALSMFETARSYNFRLYEAVYNAGQVSYQLGDIEGSYASSKMAESIYPKHSYTKLLLKEIRKKLSAG